MKVLFAAVTVALFVYISAETCPTGANSECVQHGITTCGGSYHVTCHNNNCECLQPDHIGGTCTAASDCPHCDGGNHKHCVDSRCRCTRF